MKVSQIIDNYCQRYYKVKPPEINYAAPQYFVTISPEGAGVLYLHKDATPLLGRVVCEAMKRGTVLYVHNGRVAPLLWEKWSQTWERFFAPKKKNKAPEPNYMRPYKSEIFEEMQLKRAPKKPQKHGFERTFAANKAMNLLGHPLSKIQAERITQ